MLTLKLRQTALSDNSIAALVKICPHLRRLDVSFTHIRRPSQWLTPEIGSQFEKLSLTSTAISGTELLDVAAAMPNLQTLSLGAMGGGTKTLTDSILQSLTATLAQCTRLDSLNLVGNSKLGLLSKGGSIRDLISNVGRDCKVSHHYLFQ